MISDFAIFSTSSADYQLFHHLSPRTVSQIADIFDIFRRHFVYFSASAIRLLGFRYFRDSLRFHTLIRCHVISRHVFHVDTDAFHQHYFTISIAVFMPTQRAMQREQQVSHAFVAAYASHTIFHNE
jgi:hypothetical protein